MSSFEDLYKMQQCITELYKPIMQSVNTDAIISACNEMSKSMVNITALQIPFALQESLANISKIMQETMNIEYSQIMDISSSMQTIFKSVQPNIELINANTSAFIENYTEMLSRLRDTEYNLSELVQLACNEIEDEEFIEDDFSSNEEIVETLQEQVDNPKKFQKRVANWSEAKKKKYSIIIRIIGFILINFIQPYFQDTIGKPVTAYTISKVKELPETAGKVIDELEKDVQAIITGDVPYYYRVTYTDEDGNIREGYVAKKNLKIIEVYEMQNEKEDDQE